MTDVVGVHRAVTLAALLAIGCKPGEKVESMVYREDKKMDFSVVLEERSKG